MEYQKLLEKYIRNELNEEERDQVEELLLHNREARQHLHKLEKTFSVARKHYKKKPNSISDSYNNEPQKSKNKSSEQSDTWGSKSVYKLAATFLILGFLGISGFLFFETHQDQNIADLDSDEIQELYAANFESNPYLEDVMDDVQRSADAKFELIQPDEDVILTAEQEEQVYSINFEAEAANINADQIYLRIYSNREGDYLEDQPLHQSSLEANNSTISTQIDITLEPGLYYYTFEDSQTYETFAAGRIIVN